jgi:hypothetical protein
MIHPHYDVIQEYLANKVVQRFVSPIWKDINTMQQRMSHGMGMPSFNVSDEWRVKPKTIVTETFIMQDKFYKGNEHIIISDNDVKVHNLRMTWEDNKLIKAEVI